MKPTIAAMAAKSGFDVSADGRFGNYSDMYKLEKFADMIIDECCEAVMECDTSEKMILHEPYRTVIAAIMDRLYEVNNE